MSIIVMIIVGGMVGWLAAQLMGRNEGLFSSILIGIVGSFIGSIISRLLICSDQSYLAFSWVGAFWSLVGSVVLVALMNALSRQNHHNV